MGIRFVGWSCKADHPPRARAGGSFCGGGGGGTASSSGKTITISETEFKLDPSTVDLKGAGTYVFKAKNDGQYSHALTIEGNGVEAHTDTIDSGASATVSVTLKAGTYEL